MTEPYKLIPESKKIIEGWVDYHADPLKHQAALWIAELRRQVADLTSVANGGVRHVWSGHCPEAGFIDRRDPACPACQILIGIEEGSPP